MNMFIINNINELRDEILKYQQIHPRSNKKILMESIPIGTIFFGFIKFNIGQYDFPPGTIEWYKNIYLYLKIKDMCICLETMTRSCNCENDDYTKVEHYYPVKIEGEVIKLSRKDKLMK
jgi:hypothetical protein